MTFASKLDKLMRELSLSQARLSDLTGIGRSSISQYLAGKNEPSRERKKKIAISLGVQENYFEVFETAATVQENSAIKMQPALAAKLMGASKGFVEEGLQQGRFPWGYAVKRRKWSYWINAKKFARCEEISLPWNQTDEGKDEENERDGSYSST
ncbi:MAG TPA: helix-turn-helix domain-containing protein [Firmicutes bacterium]|nr:helix-turn-helix domain-containing protein [Bacillota bacterium]